MSVYFGEKTWEEIEAAVKQNAVVILPVGTTEEHGSHLPVGTDAMIAEYLGGQIGLACFENGLPALVMETISYGFSMSAVRRWPGCPNIPTRVFMDYIYNIIDSLIEMGFQKIVTLDCHGNHDCLLRTVMREIADRRNIFIMTLSPAALCAAAYNKIKKDPEGDIHGGEFETSLILEIRPDLVKADRYTDADKITCNTILRGPVSTWGLQETKTGLYGDPTYACRETGKACIDAIIKESVKYIEAFYSHNPNNGGE